MSLVTEDTWIEWLLHGEPEDMPELIEDKPLVKTPLMKDQL